MAVNFQRTKTGAFFKGSVTIDRKETSESLETLKDALNCRSMYTFREDPGQGNRTLERHLDDTLGDITHIVALLCIASFTLLNFEQFADFLIDSFKNKDNCVIT